MFISRHSRAHQEGTCSCCCCPSEASSKSSEHLVSYDFFAQERQGCAANVVSNPIAHMVTTTSVYKVANVATKAAQQEIPHRKAACISKHKREENAVLDRSEQQPARKQNIWPSSKNFTSAQYQTAQVCYEQLQGNGWLLWAGWYRDAWCFCVCHWNPEGAGRAPSPHGAVDFHEEQLFLTFVQFSGFAHSTHILLPWYTNCWSCCWLFERLFHDPSLNP